MTTHSFKIQRIVVPHDFSKGSDEALRHASVIAQKYGASITLMHACDIASLAYPDAYIPNYDDFVQRVESAATETLKGVAAKAREASVSVEPVLRRGYAAQEIVELAKQTDADLIVMGTHGRTGLPHLLLGSVAEKVVRWAPCPVLTVPLRHDHKA